MGTHLLHIGTYHVHIVLKLLKAHMHIINSSLETAYYVSLEIYSNM